MTIYYFCNKGTGAHANCIDGANGNDGLTPATAKQTLAAAVTIWQAAAAGDQILFAQGAWWDNAATGQMKNGNSTKTNPVVIGSYDASAVWSGGAGIKPVFYNPATAIVINFNKGTVTHSEGYVVRDIKIDGGGTNASQGVFGQGDTDYVTLENLTITGMAIGIQCNGGTSSTSATSDGISSNWTIRGCDISSASSQGILIGARNTLIENCSFDHCGTNLGDHGIYIGGGAQSANPKTISSITGNGATATLTTAVPHNIPAGPRFIVTVTGSTSSGSGSFNVSSVIGVVTGPNTITYSATGTPTASVVGSYTASFNVEVENVIIRNNTLSNGNIGAAGTGNNAHIVVHGSLTGLLIENNTIYETAVISSGTNIGIEIDSGYNAAPEDYEYMHKVVVRNNTILRCAQGITLDICDAALVENNYVYSDSTALASCGIAMRSKGGFPVDTGDQVPTDVTIRYNTVYLIASDRHGISLNANVSDPSTGTGHNLYGNSVVLDSPASTSVMAFSIVNLSLSQFVLKDYNACYYTGGTVPKWEDTSSLATVQAGGSDTHSFMASTTSVTADQPFFLTPTTSPAISTSSALKNAGHPTLGPRTGWGGAVRNQGIRDIGSFEFGAIVGVVPNSPTP